MFSLIKASNDLYKGDAVDGLPSGIDVPSWLDKLWNRMRWAIG
jgi:hypothetical protein